MKELFISHISRHNLAYHEDRIAQESTDQRIFGLIILRHSIVPVTRATVYELLTYPSCLPSSSSHYHSSAHGYQQVEVRLWGLKACIAQVCTALCTNRCFKQNSVGSGETKVHLPQPLLGF